MSASIPRGGNACRQRTAPETRASRPLLLRLAAASSVALVLALAPTTARADVIQLGSPALWDWLNTTAAEALTVAGPTDDLAVGGAAVLNRSLASGIGVIGHVAPAWLRRVDLSLTFQDDLRPHYHVAAAQPFARLDGGRGVLAVEGRLDYRPSGAADTRLGLGFRHSGQDDALEFKVQAGIEEAWRTGHDRHVVEVDVNWSALRLHGIVFDEVAADPGARAPSDRFDGYEVDLQARVPFLPWAQVHARRFRHETNAARVHDDRLSLLLRPDTPLLQPGAPLCLEAGTSDASGGERRWFAEIRFTLELGPA